MPWTSAPTPLAVEGLGEVAGVPPPDTVPAFEPGEPALPLIRPVAFGWRLTSALPGAVIVEPPTDVPGELLVMEPPMPLELGEALGLPAATCAAACWLQTSKSACVCATAGAAASAPAIAASAMLRVKLAMVSLLRKPSQLQARCHRPHADAARAARLATPEVDRYAWSSARASDLRESGET